MQKTIMKDIWSMHDAGFFIVIPTNGFVRKDGTCVMGRGLALQAKTKYPTLEATLGSAIKKMGNHVFCFPAFHLFSFPVKDVWWNKASLALIEQSCKELSAMNFKIPLPVYVPKVGCGNGKLDLNEVLPILEKNLDDRFTVVL